MTELRSLRLGCNDAIADSGLENLRALTSLESLDLSQTSVTEKGLAELLSLRNLRALDLSFCALTDASAELLAQVTSLSELKLSGVKIDDAGLARLAALKNLETLDLAWTDVTDRGLMHLSTLPKLRRLSLHGDHVTDAGLAGLERLTGLAALAIEESDITAAGWQGLRRALPKADVAWTIRSAFPLAPKDAKVNGPTYMHYMYLVQEEQAIGAKLRRLHAKYGIGPTGHIADVSFSDRDMENVKEIDLNFLADLPYLESLEVEGVPIASHGIDALPKLKRLEQARSSGGPLCATSTCRWLEKCSICELSRPRAAA